MKRIAKLLIIFSALLSAFSLYGQKNKMAVHTFMDGVCTYEGLYDSTQMTEDELIATWTLIHDSFYLSPEDPVELTLAYEERKGFLTNNKFVQTPYFVELKNNIARYLEETYVVQKVRAEAKEKPEGLLQYHLDNKQVKEYADALIQGGNLLLQTYEQMTKRQMANNADPDRLWAKYLKNMESPDKLEIAFDEVLDFGWWNAINQSIYHYEIGADVYEHYFKLFKEVKTIECDET